MDENKNGILKILFGGILWGSIGPFVTILKQLGADAIYISFLRMFLAAIILLLYISLRYGIQSLKIDKGSLFICALLGLICHGINNIFYSIAVIQTGVTISAVLMNTAPIFTTLFSVILFHEKITQHKCVALMINVFGCMLAATGGCFELQNLSLLGLLAGVGSGVCYGLTAIIGKIAGNRVNPCIMSLYSYLFAAALLGTNLISNPQKIIINLPIIITGILYALIPTVIAYVLYYDGMKQIKENSKVPVIASIEIISAALLGIVIFHEKLAFGNIIGIILVLLSIILMNHKKTTIQLS